MSDPVRELLAFMIAREFRQLCDCSAPATVYSNGSCAPPVCDKCKASEPYAKYTDWCDLRHAAAIRRLLAGEP